MLPKKLPDGNIWIDTAPNPPYRQPMIRLANPADAPEILAIYAPIVRDTAISFELEPPGVGEMTRRLEAVLALRPWLVYERAGELLGYVYASAFRDRPAYRWTTEVTVYVRADARNAGLGRTLYGALFDVLRLQGYCTAIAGMTAPNAASERLHRAVGFREWGRLGAAGYKFGVWHDVVFFDLPLAPLPACPAELRSITEIAATREFSHAIERQAPGI
jgi:phosphinothricin acetyltransferase